MMFHVKHFKLIIITFTLFFFGTSPVKADEIYQCNSDYTIYNPTTDDTNVCNMPPNTFYPYTTDSHQVYTTCVCGNSTYKFGQKITSEYDKIYTNISETKLSGGSDKGQIVEYTQEFKFVSDNADSWQTEFNFNSKILCSGDITLYYYKNKSWYQVEKRSFNTYVYWGKAVPDAGINGWKYVVHCKFDIKFDFLGAGYDNGYTLNLFSWQVKSSQQQQDDIQKSIEENTRHTNTLLGAIKNAIDDIITGIANLSNTILDGLKDLFIPQDFSSTLKNGLEDISDSLGIFGYPIQLINDTLGTVIDTPGESLTVHVPSFNFKGHIIFPEYYKKNIFYFGNNLVFTNVNLVPSFTQFFSVFGINCATVTISEFVKTLMRFLTGIALIFAIIHYYNNVFGTNIEVGEEEEDDN